MCKYGIYNLYNDQLHIMIDPNNQHDYIEYIIPKEEPEIYPPKWNEPRRCKDEVKEFGKWIQSHMDYLRFLYYKDD